MESVWTFQRNSQIQEFNNEVYQVGWNMGQMNIGAQTRPSKQVFKLGERGSGLRSRGGIQDFETLRSECLQQHIVFEDNEFPAVDSSIFFSKLPDRPIKWLRPHQICTNPQFITDNVSRFDIKQGELGDCWLLASLASLTLDRRLFRQVVPDDQSFQLNYAGIFHFRFWQNGKWVEVVVDDRLPTCYGQLCYMSSGQRNEFWSALLEKAYAKLHGSYEALSGGTAIEGMIDFTGGVSEVYQLDKAPPNLFKIMMKAHEHSSLMSCSIEPDPAIVEAETPMGLIRGHAYTITSVKYADIHTPNKAGQIPLIRIRNPWGNEAEWKGAWSDKSREWNLLPNETKTQIGLTFDADGEFWMSYQDFISHFSRMEICNLSPDALEDNPLIDKSKRKWEASVFEGSWVPGATAGGCRNFLDTFWLNPQYRITLEDPDDDDNDDKCTAIVALMQKNRRALRKMGVVDLTIGFSIFKLNNPDRLPKPLDKNFFQTNVAVGRSTFSNIREVSCRYSLPPGVYCIVPSTFDPHEEGEFLLRVFSEKKNNMEVNDKQLGFGHLESFLDQTDSVPVQENIFELFRRTAGSDEEIDWMELKHLLDEKMASDVTSQGGFSPEVCRSMVAMMDDDRSGKLGQYEFCKLWTDILAWVGVFKRYDLQHTGFLSSFQLSQALTSAGYCISRQVLGVLVLRYGTKDLTISFEDFLMCAIKLKTAIEIFQAKDRAHTYTALFTFEDWVTRMLYS